MHTKETRFSRSTQWVCEVCKTTYSVPSLARECEDRHLDQRLKERGEEQS